MPIDAPPPSLQDLAVPAEVRFTVERPRVASDMHMGMAGLSYLRPVGEHGVAGVTVYGATTGDRGGFFGWGVNGAWRAQWRGWQAEAGFFAGGGGGSPGWVGDGLMLRSHLEVARQLEGWRLGVGVSQLRFPDGVVRSTQPYLTLGWSERVYAGPPGGMGAPALGDGLRAAALAAETAPFYSLYALRVNPSRTEPTAPIVNMRVGGLALRRHWPSSGPAAAMALRPYWVIAVGASVTPAYAGYAELLAGLGAELPLVASGRWALRAEAQAGSGGGGARADTGGGLMAKAGASLLWRATPGATLAVYAGVVKSRGRLEGQDVRVELALPRWDLTPGGGGAASGAGPLGWVGWTVAAGVAHHARAPRNGGGDMGLGSTFLRAEREWGPNWRVVGDAAIATSGTAGGYAAGGLGLGWLSDPGRWRFGAALGLGVAGGGEVHTGSGIYAQGQLQARWALSPAWALQAEAGWLRARQPTFSTPFVGLSAVYSFSRPESR